MDEEFDIFYISEEIYIKNNAFFKIDMNIFADYHEKPFIPKAHSSFMFRK